LSPERLKEIRGLIEGRVKELLEEMVR